MEFIYICNVNVMSTRYTEGITEVIQEEGENEEEIIEEDKGEMKEIQY